MTGMFVFSKAGHDKGQMYLVLREEGDYLYLADGRYKTLEKPKKKNRKHVQPIKCYQDEALAAKLAAGQTIYNEEIKHAIKIRTKFQEVTDV